MTQKLKQEALAWLDNFEQQWRTLVLLDNKPFELLDYVRSCITRADTAQCDILTATLRDMNKAYAWADKRLREQQSALVAAREALAKIAKPALGGKLQQQIAQEAIAKIDAILEGNDENNKTA